MAQGDLVKITYADRVFYVDGDAAQDTAFRIADAIGKGTAIVFDHQGGRTVIAATAGVPITIDYLDSEDLGIL